MLMIADELCKFVTIVILPLPSWELTIMLRYPGLQSFHPLLKWTLSASAPTVKAHLQARYLF